MRNEDGGRLRIATLRISQIHERIGSSLHSGDRSLMLAIMSDDPGNQRRLPNTCKA